MQRTQMIRWLLAALLCCLLWPTYASAQAADPLPWTIEPGYEGLAKAGAWFPVTITVANDGPDIAGTITVQQLGNADTTHSQTIDLPHGANKRIVVPVRADANQSGDVRYNVVLRNGTTVAKQQRVDVRYSSVNEATTAVLTDDEAALPSYAGITRDLGAPGGMLVRFAPTALPDRPELLQSFDVLFVHAANTAAMTDAQRDALRLWIIDGGQLVIGGDALMVQGLSDLAPAAANSDGGASGIRSLIDVSSWRVTDQQFSAPIVALEPKPGTDVVRGDNNAAILVRQTLGSGAVTQVAFDLETLSDAGPVPDLWQRLLFATYQAPAFFTLQNNGWVLQQVLDLPSLALPSAAALVLFLVLYIVAVGPLNYLLLRRMGRREWAYVSVPLLVLLFSGGAYAWGAAGRGGQTISNQLSFVRVLPDAPKGQATTYMFFFSPTRQTYDLSVPASTLLANVSSFDGSTSTLRVSTNGDRTQVKDFLIDVGGVRSTVATGIVDAPLVETTVRTINGTQQVTVRNRSNQAVDDLLLVRSDGQSAAVGTLGAGEERTLDADWKRGFPGTFRPTSGGAIKRAEVLNNMANAFITWGTDASGNGVFLNGPFGGPGGAGGFAVPTPETLPPTTEQGANQSDGLNTVADLQQTTNEQFRLIGWQRGAAFDVQLNGAPSDSDGERLYYWSVREEK